MAKRRRIQLKVSRATRRDPTKTLMVREAFAREVRRRFARLSALVRATIVANDALGIGSGAGLALNQSAASVQQWSSLPTPDKRREFNRWFERAIDDEILGGSGVDPWTDQYIERTYAKGLQQSFINARREGILADSPWERMTAAQYAEIAFAAPVHRESLQMIFDRTWDALRDVNNATKARVSQLLADGLARGDSPRRTARRIVQEGIEKIGRRRAEMVARTETIRAHAEASLNNYESFGEEGVVLVAEWSTAGDDRVCFPKWTIIDTATGPAPIQNDADAVWTRNGARKVIANTERDYCGRMTIINAEHGAIICSADHPVLTDDGFAEAGQVRRGCTLHCFGDKRVNVLGAVDFSISKPDGSYSLFEKLRVASRVLLHGLLVPILPVYLKDAIYRRQEEVDSESSELVLLNEFDVEAFQ